MWIKMMCGLLLGVVVCCTGAGAKQGNGTSGAAPSTLTKEIESTPRKTIEPGEFLPGPPITSSGRVLGTLERDGKTSAGKRRRFRLPVVVRFADSRLSITEAFIGVKAGDRAEDSVVLELDDTSLGIPLMTRLTDHCPRDRDSCAVWLEGYWGRLIEGEPSVEAAGKTGWPFAILSVGDLIDSTPGTDDKPTIFTKTAAD